MSFKFKITHNSLSFILVWELFKKSNKGPLVLKCQWYEKN